MTIGIIIGLVIAALAGFDLLLENYDFQYCICTFLIGGIILSPLFGFFGYLYDTDEEINNTIKTTINANYDNVVNYNNNYSEHSFVSDGLKYTFDYNDDTKTLTVFTDTNADVDAVFINGVKQDNQKTSDKVDKKKDCVLYKTDDTDKTDADKADSKPDTSSSSSTASSTVTNLQQKIQDKIQSRYSGTVMTGFDTINLSGTFSCNNVQYSFMWNDDMLEITNANDADDVTYYKIAQ